MPGHRLSRWRGPEPDEPLLDMIMAGQRLPPDAPRQIRLLAHRLTDLGRPAGPGELPGQAAAMSAFRQAASLDSTKSLAPPRRRRPRLMAGRTRLAAIFATAAVAVGGTAAAYADVLPGPVQEFAHRLIDAPPESRASHSPSGNQSPGKHPGGASSRSAANRKHQHVPGGIAKGHPKRKLPPQRRAGKHTLRRPAHRVHRHVPKAGASPTPTPSQTLTR
jgi:hypothetical protein